MASVIALADEAGPAGTRSTPGRATFVSASGVWVNLHAGAPTPPTWSQIDTVHITTDLLNDPTGFRAELFVEDNGQ